MSLGDELIALAKVLMNLVDTLAQLKESLNELADKIEKLREDNADKIEKLSEDIRELAVNQADLQCQVRIHGNQLQEPDHPGARKVVAERKAGWKKVHPRQTGDKKHPVTEGADVTAIESDSEGGDGRLDAE